MKLSRNILYEMQLASFTYLGSAFLSSPTYYFKSLALFEFNSHRACLMIDKTADQSLFTCKLLVGMGYGGGVNEPNQSAQ